ncbi:MBL fold metallo-hydrolase [Flavobacteriaceae bacterium]|nr:MBL fold metallo-hydrolase [Flavobacteriaceae bacterium]MDB2492903.1 MBL fold metallo-hydrolase [Flavobacteriaceae bacterium]
MKLYPINVGNFKLDGGAMFGVVPKAIWNKTNPADNNNLIDIASRCLLIEDGNRLILIDTGMGTKQSERFFNYYYRWGTDSLDGALATHGFCREDVTDVFLTHLHFDHCGGCVQWNSDKTAYEIAFKNATFWSNEDHWKWATNPNKRERASFLTENIMPIEASGRLKHIPVPHKDILHNTSLGFDVFFANGHTDKQMIPMISYKGKTICFMADLLPTVGHISVPFVMGYDTRPLLTLDEKERFLKLAADKNYYLLLEHDAHNELITVKHTEKGVRLNNIHHFNNLF